MMGNPKVRSRVASHCVWAASLNPALLTIEPGIYFIPELIDLWKKERKFVFYQLFSS